MPTNHIFLIDSDSSGHRLTVDGNRAGRFASLRLAVAMGAYVTLRLLRNASLKFELDFKWMLSDLEIRAATLEVPQIQEMEKCYVDR